MKIERISIYKNDDYEYDVFYQWKHFQSYVLGYVSNDKRDMELINKYLNDKKHMKAVEESCYQQLLWVQYLTGFLLIYDIKVKVELKI